MMVPCLLGGEAVAGAIVPESGHDDRILPVTRWLSVVIIPFLVVAFAVLYPFPGDTGRLFAWPVKPEITPMILGSVYLGGAYFFLRAAMARQWHTVKGGFVPVGTFATLMGVATILHWGKFTHSHVAFWLWTGLYFTTPFLVFAVWWANRRRAAPATTAELLIPLRVSRVIAVLGGLSVLTALFLFLFPGRAAAIWPWALTPLTARVMGAIFALGIAGLGAPADRRWASARILLQVAGLMLALILAAGLRASSELDPSNALTWLTGIGFAGLLAAIVILYARMRAQAAAAGMQVQAAPPTVPG
jgi:hypothetical protein